MAQRLTPRTLDVAAGRALKPRPLRCFLRQGTLLHFAPPHPGVKMGNGDILQGGVAILLGMLHATETGVSSGRVGLWLLCGFTLLYIS